MYIELLIILLVLFIIIIIIYLITRPSEDNFINNKIESSENQIVLDVDTQKESFADKATSPPLNRAQSTLTDQSCTPIPNLNLFANKSAPEFGCPSSTDELCTGETTLKFDYMFKMITFPFCIINQYIKFFDLTKFSEILGYFPIGYDNSEDDTTNIYYNYIKSRSPGKSNGRSNKPLTLKEINYDGETKVNDINSSYMMRDYLLGTIFQFTKNIMEIDPDYINVNSFQISLLNCEVIASIFLKMQKEMLPSPGYNIVYDDSKFKIGELILYFLKPDSKSTYNPNGTDYVDYNYDFTINDNQALVKGLYQTITQGKEIRMKMKVNNLNNIKIDPYLYDSITDCLYKILACTMFCGSNNIKNKFDGNTFLYDSDYGNIKDILDNCIIDTWKKYYSYIVMSYNSPLYINKTIDTNNTNTPIDNFYNLYFIDLIKKYPRIVQQLQVFDIFLTPGLTAVMLGLLDNNDSSNQGSEDFSNTNIDLMKKPGDIILIFIKTFYYINIIFRQIFQYNEDADITNFATIMESTKSFMTADIFSVLYYMNNFAFLSDENRETTSSITIDKKGSSSSVAIDNKGSSSSVAIDNKESSSSAAIDNRGTTGGSIEGFSSGDILSNDIISGGKYNLIIERLPMLSNNLFNVSQYSLNAEMSDFKTFINNIIKPGQTDNIILDKSILRPSSIDQNLQNSGGPILIESQTKVL